MIAFTGLTDAERAQRIALLTLWTGWSASVFERMDDKRLLEEYERRVGV